MTVCELENALSEYPEDAEVMCHEAGYWRDNDIFRIEFHSAENRVVIVNF